LRSLPLILAFAGCSGTPAEESDAPGDADRVADLAACSRYEQATASVDEGVWTGDPATCDPGEAPSVGVDNAMRLVNYARELAGVDALELDPAAADGTQECALMMHANASLSHQPPDTWECWTQAGATAAARSLLAREPSVGAMLQYLVDFGNETTLVHRRWLLNPAVPRIALGSTDAFSCLRLGSTTLNSTGWIAWPPPGRVPLAMLAERNSSVDAEGWSIQSDDIDLSAATVAVVTAAGRFSQEVEVLESNQGSRYAIRFLPDGFSAAPGSFSVEVGGVVAPFEYEVRMVDCGALAQ
jgi:hypothetical protein